MIQDILKAMEKHDHPNSQLQLLQHLPRIIQVFQILNMLVYGFVMSQPVVLVSALNSLQKSLRIAEIFQQVRDRISQQACH